MKILWIVLLLLLVPLTSASLGYFKQGECVSIRVLANCSAINLTEVNNGNVTYIINTPMTNIGGQTFNYSFCNTSRISEYSYSWNNPCLDCSSNDCGNSFEITGNGKANPSGGIIVLFVIFYLILVGGSCYLVLYSIGHLMNLDFSITDLAIDWGVYLVAVCLFYLEEYYFGNPGFRDFLLWFLLIGGILLVFIPVIAFIISMIIGSMNRRKSAIGQPPRTLFEIRRKL